MTVQAETMQKDLVIKKKESYNCFTTLQKCCQSTKISLTLGENVKENF